MTTVHRMYVQLLMYDLPSAEHEGMRQFLRGHGEEGHAWVRVQRSIILLKTLSTPGQLRTELEGYASGDIFIVDVSSTGYSGTATKAVWEWLRAARAESAALHEQWAKAKNAVTRLERDQRMRKLPADDPVLKAHEARQAEIADLKRRVSGRE